MAIKINFSPNYLPEMPTYVLTTRNGRNIGSIVPYDINFHDEFGQYSSFSFTADKNNCAVWDDLTNFKLIYHKESDEFYEINVELDESDQTTKIVTATSLGYAELSQIKLYGIEINTEDDIARDTYVVTTLFNEDDHTGSLLHRITEKCPHYTIAHVDDTIAGIQRSFSFDNTTVMDALNEIAEEIDCVFMMKCGRAGTDGIARRIYVYDLESYCNNCGKRTTGVETCEHCGSRDLTQGYGEDTTILVTTDNLTNDIRLSVDTGAVKNCFRLTAGDDYMSATIRNCNPNGSDYLWYINDETRAEMSDELREKIEAYDTLYNSHVYDGQYEIDEDVLVAYNALVEKYSPYNDELVNLSSPLIGYQSVTNAMYDVIDFGLFLSDGFMPSAITQDTDAATELAKLTAESLSTVAVQNIKSASNTTVNSTIESIIKVTVNAAYKPEILTSNYVQDESREFGTWTGSFRVTSYSDEEDTAESGEITLTIDGDMETFLRQRINRALNQQTVKDTDIKTLFGEELEDFRQDIKLYCLEGLRSLYDAARACIDVLVEQGAADNVLYPRIYSDVYVPYFTRMQLVEEEILLREQEVAVINGATDEDGNLISRGMQNILDEIRASVASDLDFESYLGTKLWKEFAAYRREDEYSNSNFISDGLSNAEIFALTREFVETAQKELIRSATKQHSITSTLHNLLAIKEFAPLVDHFAVGNWLRVRVDGKLFKLRLLSYDINFNDLSSISVTFSDVHSLSGAKETYAKMMRSLSSMASSYGAVMRQANRGGKSQDTLSSWQEDGLSLTAQKIVSDAKYQEVIYGDNGILLRKYVPETGTYDPAQTKIINQGLYVTDNNWQTARAGIGHFSYYDPYRKENVTAYGVIADTIVGNMVLSSNVHIFNETGSIRLDQDGFVSTSANSNVAVIIQPNNADGVFVIRNGADSILTVNNSGDLVVKGYLSAAYFEESTGVTVDSDGFRLYGTVPIYADELNATIGGYVGYSPNVASYTSEEGTDGMLICNADSSAAIVLSGDKVYIKGTVFVNGRQLSV